MIYWILKETLGYSYGFVNFKENVPEGAEIQASEGEQLEAIEKLEANLQKELDDFFINEPAKLEAELNKEFEKEIKLPPGQVKKDEDLNQEDRRNGK